MNGDDDDDGRDAYDDYESDEMALAAPERNQLVKRSFDGVATLMQNAATQALTAKATADINARWMIAMHRPRDMDEVRQTLLTECKRPGFAVKSIYEVPRGGSKIRGLTIRFAEEAMRAMGNMDVEAVTLYDDDEERVVRVRATDYQRNASWSRDLTIKKTKEVKSLKNGERALSERINSSGQVVYKVEATDDDVVTKESAAISKAARTAILRIIPGWLVEQCRTACEQTQRDRAAKDPDLARRMAVDAWASIGIKVSWLVEWLGKPLEQALPEELVELERLFRAVKEKETTAAAAMAARKGEPDGKPASVAASAVRRGQRKPEPPPQESEEDIIRRQEAEEARRNAGK